MILQDVFHPENMGEQLSVDQMNKLDAAAKTDTSLPMTLQPDPGMFDGMGSAAWAGLRSGLYKTGSSLLGAASETFANPVAVQSAVEDANEELADQGFHIDNPASYGERQAAFFDRQAKEFRQTAKSKFSVDPATMGTVARILHGVTETIPEAVGYGVLGGPAGGSVLFGADMGIRTAQELKDKGVDEKTATNAGIASFASNAIGMRLPAALGPNRIVSALGGAGLNVGATAAEQGTIAYILDHQNYSKLAEQYQITLPSLGTSAVFGAAMGALFFHSKPTAMRRAEERTTRQEVENTLYARLMATDTYKGHEKEAREQARLQSTSVINLAKASGHDAMDILPEVKFDEGGKVANEGEVLASQKPNNLPTDRPDTLFEMQRRSYDFDNILRMWAIRRGSMSFNLGRPSWVLQLFGVNKDVSLTVDRSSFVHVLFRKGERDLYNEGKHGLNPGKLQGLLIGIQHPVAVFKSVSKHVEPGSKSLVLMTELKYEGQNIIVPLRLTVEENGHVIIENTVRSTYGKRPNTVDQWAKDGLLLGYDAEKGPRILPMSIGSNSAQLGESLPSKVGASEEPRSPLSTPIVYQNNNSIGNNYQVSQIGEKSVVRGYYKPNDNSIHLTANANLATFSHEWGHWYLTNLFNMARDNRLTSEMREDVETLLRSFGIKALKDWDDLGFEGQEVFQEQFARQLEQYLATGKAPGTGLRYIFEAIADTIREAYRAISKKDVSSAIAEEYKAQTGKDLPPMSKEVKDVFDRMYKEQESRPVVNADQVAAARTAQSVRLAEIKRNQLRKPASEMTGAEIKARLASLRAEEKTLLAIADGKPVDVSGDVPDMNLNERHVETLNSDFARTYMAEGSDHAVVLQNRDRSRLASVTQMNSIASNPQYGLLSFNRGTSGGAPIVSFGKLPPKAQLGRRDIVTDPTGVRTPVWYTVVEAEDVVTSNRIDGSVVPEYGDPNRINAVAGNGRATGLQEAYRRGTADKYRSDLENDTIHGVDPEVIKKMKHPILVRFISPDDVTTGFISRSNQDQVMARSDVEIAREDAPKIRARIDQYHFDENGRPDIDTVRQFIADTGEQNALGNLINARGEPTPQAVRRIRQAVFFEAYRDPVLASLFSEDLDSGVVRVLNGLVSVAPQIISLREASNGRIDLARPIVEAANQLYTAKKAGNAGADISAQGSLLDSSAANPFLELFSENAASAAGIRRVLGPTLDWAMRSLDAGEPGGLFGDAEVVRTDVADVVAQMRSIENAARAESGLPPLPEVKAEDIRANMNDILNQSIEITQGVEKIQQKVDEVREQQDAGASSTAPVNEPPVDIETRRSEAIQSLDESKTDEIRVRQLIDERPDLKVTVTDANGNEVQVSAEEALRMADEEVARAETDAAAMGQAVTCVLNNRGLE